MVRFTIPIDIESQLLPRMDIMIHDLLLFLTPPINELLQPSPEGFHKEPSLISHQHISILRGQPLPFRDTTTAWRRMAEDLGTEYQSFTYPVVQNAGGTTLIRLPLWITEFWRRMHDVVDAQKEWREGVQWLDEKASEGGSNEGVFLTATSVVRSLQWSIASPGSANLRDRLSIYLGPHWLSDTHIEQLGNILTSRIDRTDVLILDPLLFLKLESLYRFGKDSYSTTKDAGYIRSLGDGLRASPTAWVGGVVNTAIGPDGATTLPGPYESGNHWAAFAYSRATGTLAYGDSLHGTFPTELRDILQWWINQHLGDHDISVAEMACTEQQDAYSCGILAFNALCHHLLPQLYTLVDEAKINEARVELFLKVITNLQSDDWAMVSNDLRHCCMN